MDPTVIETFITSVGFPIAATVAMFYMLNKEREANKEEREKDREERRQESEKWVSALNNNTIVIERLTSKLEREKEDAK